MPIDPHTTWSEAEREPIVAVFDSKEMALRTVRELRAAEIEDVWLGIIRGETDAGETTVSVEGGDNIALHLVLSEHGARADLARRFEGILPPLTAVMALRFVAKREQAIRIIEMAGGHIEFV